MALFYTWALLIICIAINQTLSFLFGYNTTLFHIFVPINEEYIRLISVMKGPLISWLFTLSISIYESIIYSIKINASVGYIPISFIIIRIFCIIVHFLLMGTQIFFWKYYKKYDKKIYAFAGYFFAVALHYTWNTKVSLIVLYFMK